ncbi:uncharacterized protein [Macrobrachium rosenbergii]|uniref:uncharacterized protein n=1 Tax=Macrobrachium rosenbergii TaxID=79674 RepID=UPI0034D727CF
MSRERRQSAASSGLSDITSAPAITEDEIKGMTLEQLECAAEELQNLCSCLQAEVDLYSRYLSSQVIPDNQAPSTLAPTSLSESGTTTPTLSSLDVRGLWHGQIITRGRTQHRVKLSNKEKYRLWQRELEIVLANRRKQGRLWERQLHKCQASTYLLSERNQK